MNDDLSDLDPVEVEKIVEHADEFIALDAAIEEIMQWGDYELALLERKIQTSDGTPLELKEALAGIEAQVAQKLRELEDDVRKKYGQPTTS